ncbi:MAG: hypothetical protein K2X39_03815 [Silvanigrellaceae bacterium]|nr:hypothetical protein [Silvanigrellaceae bacterium]
MFKQSLFIFFILLFCNSVYAEIEYICKINYEINKIEFDEIRLENCLYEAKNLGQIVHINILSSTSDTGAINLNRHLAHLRALKIKDFLTSKNKIVSISYTPSPFNQEIGLGSFIVFYINKNNETQENEIKNVNIHDPTNNEKEIGQKHDLAFSTGNALFIFNKQNDQYRYFSTNVSLIQNIFERKNIFLKNFAINLGFSLYTSNEYLDLYEYTIGLSSGFMLRKNIKLNLSLENSLVFNTYDNPSYNVGGSGGLMIGFGRGFYAGFTVGKSRLFNKYGLAFSKEF